ncbi:MAG: SHOCT domain-containing protein [Chloroflexota bacterium]|nr:SHOCT domain-containing protein [Chloroflexota bacterium]
MNQNIRTALIVGGIAVALVVVMSLVGGFLGGWQGGGRGMMGPGWGWGGLFMPIFMIIFWVLIIWAVVALVRGTAWSGRSDLPSDRPDSALEILKRRYARGEVSKEEFEDKKKDLA